MGLDAALGGALHVLLAVLVYVGYRRLRLWLDANRDQPVLIRLLVGATALLAAYLFFGAVFYALAGGVVGLLAGSAILLSFVAVRRVARPRQRAVSA